MYEIIKRIYILIIIKQVFKVPACFTLVFSDNYSYTVSEFHILIKIELFIVATSPVGNL